MKETRAHLNEEQIVLSLVDENDLPEAMRRHLKECLTCRNRRKSLAAELDHLGKMASELAPVPQRKPVVSSRKSRRFSFRFPVFASAVAVLVLAVFLFRVVLFTDSSRQHIDANLATQADVRLYLVGELLAESPLPECYRDITLGSYSYFDDDFLEFVAPLEEHIDSV